MKRLHRIAIMLVDESHPATRDELGYLSLGHNFLGGQDEMVLWMWDGTLHVHHVAAEDASVIHSRHWPGSELHYRGRYDSRQKIVSLLVPVTKVARFRPPPEALLRDLADAFPDATAIHNFGWG